MNGLKKKIGIASTILLCAFVGAFSLLVMGCVPDKKADTGYVKVEIAGRVFKVPKGYFDGAAPSGRDTESVVLEYSLPGFEVLPSHPLHRKERQELIDEGRMKGMLLENASKRPSFDIVVPNLMHGHEFKEDENIVYGLEKYVHQAPTPVSSDPAYAPYVQDDVFIERNPEGSIKSYLMCSPPGKDKIPGCSHRFVDKGLLYKIRWRVAELPNWREQREAAIKFIDSFEIKHVEHER